MARQISAEEIAKHNTEKSCWIVLCGRVYDVTEFLDDHPGGVEIVVDLAGGDATKAFEDVGHSKEALAMLPKYLKGEMIGAEIREISDKPSDGQSGVVMGLLVLVLAVAAGFFFYSTKVAGN